MIDIERIIEALEQMSEAAQDSADTYAEERDVWYAKGIEAALSKAQSIADGF